MDSWNIRNMQRISGGDAEGKIHQKIKGTLICSPKTITENGSRLTTSVFFRVVYEILKYCSNSWYFL